MGGKTFTDQSGNNPASRIPTSHVVELEALIIDEFSCFFDQIKMATIPDLFDKKDHGDIDFVCLKSQNSINDIRDYVKSKQYLYKKNGDMIHILYPFTDEKKYQVDFILSKDIQEFETCFFFYSQSVTFNAIVGHFSRSIGYKFSTKGLLLHITDKRGQNYYFELTRDISTILDLLCLEKKDSDFLYKDPINFAKWISSSPRFDFSFFKRNENKNSHRDAKKEVFCGKVYDILEKEISKRQEIPGSHIDFTKDGFDLKETLKHERKILGDDIVDKIISFCEEKQNIQPPVIRGDVIIGMGYPPGPIIGKIINDVSSVFSNNDSIEEMKVYILKNYPI